MLESTQKIKELLKKYNIKIDKGITHERLLEIEEGFGFKMPTDLSDLLLNFVPIKDNENNLRFLDWNNEKISSLVKKNKEIIDGILFDIEENNFWYEPWGIRPEKKEDRMILVIENLKKEIIVYPLSGHRYIIANPNNINNPVISIVQTDIIYYGNNLLSYYYNEIHKGDKIKINHSNLKKVPFWTDFIEKINNS